MSPIAFCQSLLNFVKRSFARPRAIAKMNSLLLPPDDVRGMKIFSIDKFTKSVLVPVIDVNKNDMEAANKVLKNYIIKLNNFKPVRDCSNNGGYSTFYLDPVKLSSCANIELGFVPARNDCKEQIELGYENWNHDDVLKAILPENLTLSSYSTIGSIIHVNLKPELLDYKHIIGKVLKDKHKGCKSVVNKVDNINNVFRNFEYEVICGSSDLETTVKENKCLFDLDLSEVYWNPRLCTEHERILRKLKSGDVLYDVFAGIGPFSVPAAKMGCVVLANDLNPNCCKWLKVNKKKNRIKDEHLTIMNKDGSKFIQEDIKSHLISWSKKSPSTSKIHVTMNLPAIAVEFIKYFNNLFEWEEITDDFLPILHVYAFIKTDISYDDGLKLTMDEFFNNVTKSDIIEILRVRNVAPNKEMVRITFQTRREVLCKPEVLKRKFIENTTEDVKRSKED